jgi:hypothetical protein
MQFWPELLSGGLLAPMHHSEVGKTPPTCRLTSIDGCGRLDFGRIVADPYKGSNSGAHRPKDAKLTRIQISEIGTIRPCEAIRSRWHARP